MTRNPTFRNTWILLALPDLGSIVGIPRVISGHVSFHNTPVVPCDAPPPTGDNSSEAHHPMLMALSWLTQSFSTTSDPVVNESV